MSKKIIIAMVSSIKYCSFILLMVLFPSCKPINTVKTVDDISIKKSYDSEGILYLEDFYINSSYSYSRYYTLNLDTFNVYLAVTTPPRLNNDTIVVKDFIRDNVIWPDGLCLSGSTTVCVLINKEGIVIESRVIRDVCKRCGVEAVKVVGKLPDWKPAVLNTETVASLLYIPVRFDNISVGRWRFANGL